MAAGSARWQRLPQSMPAKDFPSDTSVFFELGNEIICSKSNGTFENDSNVNTASGALEKLRTDNFQHQWGPVEIRDPELEAHS